MKISVKFLALIGWRGVRSFILLGLIFFISHVLRLWTRCYYLRGFSAQLCMFEVCSSFPQVLVNRKPFVVDVQVYLHVVISKNVWWLCVT